MKKYFWFWNIDYKRYQLLKILSKNRTLRELRIEKHEKLGISFEEICNKLNCNKEYLHGVTSEMYENDEILYTDIEVKGLYGKRKGIESNVNRKYLKRYFDIWLNLGKNFSQIVIPTASLIIATIVLLKDTESIDTKLKELKKEIVIELKEKQTYINYPKQNHKAEVVKDSLTKK